MEKRSIDFIPQIDGLRFIAVFGVMLNHWLASDFSNSYILSKIPFGTGVNLFFVISGFLITFILLKKKDEINSGTTTFSKEIKNFYAKRTLRIFPIYYLLIAILCFYSYESIKQYLAYLLTYTINWFMVINNTFIGDKTHLWSLAVEEQFYLIWPFLVFIVPKRFTLYLIVLAILTSIASKIYFLNSHFPMGMNGSTFSCFDALGLGALVAYLQKKRIAQFKAALYKFLLIVSLVLFVLFFIDPGYLSPDLKNLFLNSSTALVYFFLVIIAANSAFGGGIKDFLENRTILYLGKISYGLYLYHNFMGTFYFSGINQYFPKMTGNFDLFLMYFLFTVLLASVSWYLIERPVLGLKKYFQ